MSKFKVFISHKHQDKKFADPVREFIQVYGAGVAVEVFQSSDPLGRGPGSGRVLTLELRDAVASAGLFILIYSYPDLDWDFCMMELGMALDPSTPQTRVMVLNCAGRPVLQTLAGLTFTDLAQETDVRRFAQAVLSDPESFPGVNEPLTALKPDDTQVERAGRDLFAKFATVSTADVSDGEWAQFPFLLLELPMEVVKQIKDGTEEKPSPEMLAQLTLRASSGLAKVFQRFEAKTLCELLPDDGFASLRDYFADMIFRTARSQVPVCIGPTVGAGADARIPVLARLRRVASLNHMVYEIFLLPLQTMTGGAATIVAAPSAPTGS